MGTGVGMLLVRERLVWVLVMVSVFVGLLAELVLGSGGGVCWRAANAVTRDLGVKVVGYGVPVLSLLWLFRMFLVGFRSRVC